jgi:hypothetical protein
MNQASKTSTLTSPSIEPKWGPEGNLQITGELTLLSVEIICNHVLLGSKVLAKDELGTVWDISGRNFISEAQPHTWPEIYGMYWLLSKPSSYSARGLAKSFEEAKTHFLRHYSWIAKDPVILDKITDPNFAYTATYHRRAYVWA